MSATENNKQKLIGAVEKELPDFIEIVNKVNEGDSVIFSQAAFASDFHEDEIRLLGMAVKYAGLMGRVVTIVPEEPNT